MEPPTPAEKQDIANKFLDNEAAGNPGTPAVFFKYYESLFRGPPGSYVVNVARPAYSSHAEVVRFFDYLIGNTSQTKADFSCLYATDVATNLREHGIRALLQASLMIDCALKQHLPEGRKVGDFVPRTWGEKQSFANFVESCFPSPAQGLKVRQESESPLAQRGRLKAWKLKEWHKLRLRPTDNLAEHLVFDPDGSVVHVFRQVGWLKAHLRRSRNEDLDTGFAESLEKGTLPPQLLLEVLDSIQYLLFPNDPRSYKSLQKFINKYDFDPQAKYFQRRIRAFPEDFEYKYLGNRVATLLKVVDKPPAANGIVAWVERHTSERSALTVAIVGLFLTALIGFLSLIVAAIALFYSIKQYDLAAQNPPALLPM